MVSDHTDRLADRGDGAVAAVVVGIFDVDDAADPFWHDDTSLLRPQIRQVSAIAQVDDATGLAAVESYPDLASRVDPALRMRYTWRYAVDPAALDSSRVESLLSGLGRMQAFFPNPVSSPGSPPSTGLQGNLRGLVEGFAQAWRSIQSVFLVIGIGVAAVAFAALGLVTVLASARRRAVVGLWRGRGASEAQVIRSSIAEAMVLVVPWAALALVAAFLVVRAGAPEASIALGVAIALGETMLVIAAAPPTPAGPPRDQSRDARATARTQPRRLVAEGLVIFLAIVGAYLLRERGVRGTSSTGELAAADPFIAAVPALAGVALGLVVMRLFPLPMRLLAALSSVRRDLVPVLALRRLTRSTMSGAVLLVLLATGAVWAFASAALVHLERASEVVAWQEVGADYRVTAGSVAIPVTFDATKIPGVEAAAAAYQGPAALRVQGITVSLVALDVADYLRVVAGTPGDPHLPAQMRGAGKTPLPAIVSAALAEGSRGIEAGETFELAASGARLSVTAVESRASFPGVESDDPFVIISRDQLLDVRDDILRSTTVVFVRAPDSANAALTAEVSGHVERGQVDRRYERIGSIQGSPVVGIVRDGALASVAAAAVFAVLAVAAAMALTGAARATEVAHLRAIGLTQRQGFSMLLIEHVPTVAVAFAAGLALGFGLFVGLRPSLGLAAVVGSPIEVPVELSLTQAALILGAIVVIVATGLVLAAAVQRRVLPALALRRGGE
jgi:putative ABC transport system permease protein